MKPIIRISMLLVAGAGLLGAAWFINKQGTAGDGGALGREPGQRGPVPVQVATIEEGPIEQRHRLSGTLEPAASFVVTSKISGRVEKVTVELGDRIDKGQVVVQLDDDELIQAAAEARAALAVAKAESAAAESAFAVTQVSFERVERLLEEGIATRADHDTARAEYLSAEAAVQVAKAQVTRARAALRAAEVRASYARAKAAWAGDDETRVVAERFVDEGQDVSAGAPLVSVVDLDPVVAVVFATEKDYAELEPGERVHLTTDAYPGKSFEARVARVAPVFQAESRQARVELEADNADGRLKPGMFVRAEVVLDRVEDARTVPEDALVTRDGKQGVFVVSDDGGQALFRPVQVGLAHGGRVSIEGEDLTSPVIILGHHELADGDAIVIPDGPVDPSERPSAAPPRGEAP